MIIKMGAVVDMFCDVNARSFLFRLKPLDVKFMKAVDHKVNIVPVIAKADTLTKQEVIRLKHKVTLKFMIP